MPMIERSSGGMERPRSAWRRSVVAAIAAVVLMASASPTRAQLAGGMEALGTPPVSSADVVMMQEEIGFGDDARELIAEMQTDHLERYQRAYERFLEVQRGFMQEAQQGDLSGQLDVTRKFNEFRRARDQARERFFDDVRVVLTNEQQQRWERFERRYRRERMEGIDAGIFLGGDIDLVEIVREMELGDLPNEQRAALEAGLERYAVELDRIVQRRFAMVEDFATRRLELMEEHGGNPMSPEAQALYGSVVDEGREVIFESRELQKRHADRIERTLPAEHRARFREAFDRQYAERVYAPSATGRAFTTALAMEDLTAEQRAAIEPMRERYERELASANRGWVEAIEAAEAEMTIQHLWGLKGQPEELTAARDARRKLDAKTLAKLRELLTDEQASVLPEPEAIDWREAEAAG
jgi:hypothetical protein